VIGPIFAARLWGNSCYYNNDDCKNNLKQKLHEIVAVSKSAQKVRKNKILFACKSIS
jgi:hypothetical protein